MHFYLAFRLKVCMTNIISTYPDKIWKTLDDSESRKQWDIFKMLEKNNCRPKILYPVKISFRNKG